MSNKLEFQQQRNEIIDKMAALNDKALEENRALTKEEEAQYSSYFQEQAALKVKIDGEHKNDKRHAEIALLKEEMRSVPDKAHRPEPNDESKKKKIQQTIQATDEYREAFDSYLLDGNPNHFRDLQMDLPQKGGFLVAPEQMVAGILKNVDDLVLIRGLATKYQITQAHSLGQIKMVDDVDDAEWTSELATGSESAGPTFGKRELYPHPLAKQVKCSMKLLRASAINIEAWLAERLSYKFAVAEENAFMTGSGVNEPLGLFTVSADGISAGRDVLTGATNDYTFDGLITALYTLKDQYRRNSSWLLPRLGIMRVAKLKDLENRYLWEPSRQVGSPDSLLGRPVISSEFAPSTFSNSQYVGMIADFSKYVIADALDMTVARLNELGYLSNQVIYVGRKETDAQPSLEEAFVRLVTNP